MSDKQLVFLTLSAHSSVENPKEGGKVAEKWTGWCGTQTRLCMDRCVQDICFILQEAAAFIVQ